MASSTQKSAYAQLGLHKGAGQEDIKQAYVELVKKFDPERHTERFMMIQKAFDTLKDPVRRAQEDLRTFNYIKGQFLFNPEERSNAPETQINQIISQIEQKLHDGEVAADEAGPKLIQGYMLRSFKKVQKKLWAEAIQDWEMILKIDPTHRRAKNNMMHSFLTLGYSYASHGLYDEAVEVWEKAAQMDPDNYNVIHNLALGCDFAGDKEQAAKYWRETVKRWKAMLERQPENEYLKHIVIEFHRQYGEQLAGFETKQAAHAVGDKDKSATGSGGASANGAGLSDTRPRRAAQSVADYKEILRLNPDDFEARLKLASKYMEDHTWKEAIGELETITRKHPKDLQVMNLLGWALLNSGQVDRSFMIWNKAHAIDKSNPTIIESLIKARMSMGRTMRANGLYTQCLVHFKALLRLLPKSDEVFYEIGQTYQLQGNEREAYRNYQQSLALNPKNKDARQGMTTLKLRR